MITEAQKKYLLSLTPDDLTFSTLVDLFGDTVDPKTAIKNKPTSKFNTTDEMVLNPGEYFVKEKTNTTVGRFIYNKYIVERIGLQDILGYVNEPLTAGAGKKNEALLAKALVEDRMTVDQFYDYVDYRDNLGMQLHPVICASFTMNTIKTPASVQKKKAELFKKYDKELKDGDIVISERIEKELMKMAKDELKGDPGLDLYDSEARGNYGNYKNMNLFKGATMNNSTGKFEIVQSSFMDGIRKEDIHSFGNAVIAGDYPKAVGRMSADIKPTKLLETIIKIQSAANAFIIRVGFND